MHARVFVALTVFFGLVLAGCGGTNVTPGAPAASSAALFRSAPTLRVKHDNASYKRALYVLDRNANKVKILTNTYFRELGVITDGITDAIGETIDGQGNLYVANQFVNSSTGNVVEYAPGDTSPSFTYNAYMGYPNGVAVDRHGNVFEADQSFINQYFQHDNTLVATCGAPSGTVSPIGVAIDGGGDVFATYVDTNSQVDIYEFIGGLSNCNATFLISVGRFAVNDSLALDGSNDLIVAQGSSVDVIDPPYTAVTRTIGSSLGTAISVSLNSKNKLAFVADHDYNQNVTVINYQTGANVKVIGVQYGITAVWAAVDAPNAVY